MSADLARLSNMSDRKPTLATLRLSGCSRCIHFSSGLHPRFRDLSQKMDLVYSPLLGRKPFPELVDITLVEGAVANEDDLMLVKKARPHTNVLISLGDCALIPDPNLLKPLQAGATVSAAIDRAFVQHPPAPGPELAVASPPLDRARPAREIVPVDIVIPGCPPAPDEIYRILSDLLANL